MLGFIEAWEKKKRAEIQEIGAKVKPMLGLCSIEVREIVYIHSLS